MPLFLSYLMILITATGGWIIAALLIRFNFRPYAPKKIIWFTFSGILPALKVRLARDIAAAIGKKYLSDEIIDEKISNHIVIKQLRPEIESHIDHFLKERLPEDFPLLSKFMGEKTLFKFKQSFLTEVEVIFPLMLKSYSEKMLREWNPEKLIEQELIDLPIPSVEAVFYRKASKYLLLFKLIGAMIGGIIGLVQWLILYIVLG